MGVLFDSTQVVELRCPGTKRGTVAGYFDDHARLWEAAKTLDGTVAGVYVTLNPVNPALLARAENRLVSHAKSTTSDQDILRRRWLPVDLDPVRPAGISSTDAEHEAALVRAKEIRTWLAERGWPSPILADSGNGSHLLYRIDLPNDAEVTKLVGDCLQAIALQFSDAAVEVDVATKNAARIWKLYGTTACKGDDTPDRPHRKAQILDTPDPVEVAPTELLMQLADSLPQKPLPIPANGGTGSFDLDSWIAESGLSVEAEGGWDGTGRKWILSPCPWNPDHTNRSAYIVQFANGAIAAGCHHNGCADKDWYALRKLVDPRWEPSERAARTLPLTHPLTSGQGVPLDRTQRAVGSSSPPIRGGLPPTTHFERSTLATLRGRATSTRYLTAGVFYQPGVALVAGPPGCGKTWLTLSLALSVALARRWLGRFACEPGAALLVMEEEDAGAVVERMDLLLAGLGLSPEEGDALPLHYLIQEGVSLITPEGTLDPELLRHIEEVKPSLLILDPFRRLHNLEENDSAAMSFLFSLLRRLAVEQDLSILVVHHLRKRGEFDEGLDRLRGSSDIAASADTILEISGQFGNQVVRHGKAKRGPSTGTWLVVGGISAEQVQLRHLDPDIQAEIDRDSLRKWLLDTLEAPQNLRQLCDAGKPVGFGKDRIRRMLEGLEGERLVQVEMGPRNSRVYSRNDQSARGARVPPTTTHQQPERELCTI